MMKMRRLWLKHQNILLERINMKLEIVILFSEVLVSTIPSMHLKLA